jgi:hypothetical protein
MIFIMSFFSPKLLIAFFLFHNLFLIYSIIYIHTTKSQPFSTYRDQRFLSQ